MKHRGKPNTIGKKVMPCQNGLVSVIKIKREIIINTGPINPAIKITFE